MDLSGLPQFTVLEVRPQRADGNSEIVGRFSHLRGVRSEDGYLYRANGPSVVGGFNAVPRDRSVYLDVQHLAIRNEAGRPGGRWGQ
jgi:hypothetical protein